MKRHAPTTEGVWEELHSRLHSFVSRRVSNPADVDDIVQEVFLRIHQKIGTLEHEERLYAWVYQITRNIIIDYYRAPRREEPILTPDIVGQVPDEDEIHSEVLQEMASCLSPILDTIPAAQREALRLTELQGMTQLAAAQQLGLSHSGVKSRVQRGRKQLRDALLRCCQVELDRRGEIINYQVQGQSCVCCDDCT